MPVSCTVRQIVVDAMLEIGAIAAGEALSADDGAYALSKFNRLIDNWNAERAAVYNVSFATYTLTPSLSPHTIGPTGTFVVDQRPVSVEGANIILNNVSPTVKSPLHLRDDQWWLNQRVPGISTTLPTDLYYSPDWPNGSLWLWPIPTVAYGLELETRVLLANVVLTDTVSLPPGYRDALTLTLAEDLATPYGRALPPALPALAMRARARIFANNDIPPRLVTWDSGMPQSNLRPDFNYRTGQRI